MSDYDMKKLVNDSQDFRLYLSESTIGDTRNGVSTDKMGDRDDIIVISDSGSDSSAGCINPTGLKPGAERNVTRRKKTTYPRSYFLEISEDEEERLSEPWPMLDIKSLDKCDNKISENINNIIYTSDETTISSNDSNSNGNMKIGTNKCDSDKSYKIPISIDTEQKIVEKYSTKQTNKVITPNNSRSKVLNRLNQLQTYDTPLQNNIERMKLTTEDTQKIWRNIRQATITYDSPRNRKETDLIIDESTDADEDVIHPAISPKSNKKLMCLDNSCDVINTSLKDIIPDSQESSPKPYHTHVNHSPDMPKEEQFHKSLSEKKKKQIVDWLMMANSSDSRSDSSCSNIPPSTINSKDSGDNSLERLELNYETPNNRGKIIKTQTAQHNGKNPIANADRVIQAIPTCKTTLDRFIQKSRNNNSEFKTPDRSTLPLKADKDICETVNTPEMGVKSCTDILDKLYGKSWRNKANAVLSEPRKTPIQIINRIIQTEKKPLSKKYYVTDSDSEADSSNSNKNKIKIRKKKNRQKQKKFDSFINDESLSDDDESIYYTALTDSKTCTNTVSKSVPVPTSVKRLQAICDSEESDKSGDSKKNLGRKKLFNDNESSGTSEFDPGDYVPPKDIHRKETVKTSQPPKIVSRFLSKNFVTRSFLASLSNTVLMSNVHPDAKKYRSDYKNNKEALCKELYKLYNEKVFDDKLPRDMPIEWNIRMRGTAGYCYNKKSMKSLSGIVKSSRIVLATKILDTPDRLRDTLIHEMCHAAAWLLNDVSDGHGPFWTGWANKAMKTFPELPPIRRCHDYEIKTKFTYKCTGCGYSIGRHSKSLDIEKKRCGHCFGKFELLLNKTTKSGTVQIQTPRKEPSGFALYVKQNYSSIRKEKNNMRHAEVMKILSQQFSAIKIAKKDDPNNA